MRRGSAGLDIATLSQRLALKPAEIDPAVSQLKSVVIRVGSRLWSAGVAEKANKNIRKQVADHHKAKPLEKGAPVADLRAASRIPDALFDHVLHDLIESKKLVSDGGLLRQPGFSIELSDAEDKLAKATILDLQPAGAEPPTVTELAHKHGDRAPNILPFLERTNAVVQPQP